MEAERQTAAAREDAMNFGERFLNVHVRESNGGNDAIETFPLEWQALSGSELIHAVWKSSAGSRQTRSVDVEPRNFIRRGDAPRKQIQSRAATQVEHPHGPCPRIFLLADRKSTRLNSSHLGISYAVFCLKKKKEH